MIGSGRDVAAGAPRRGGLGRLGRIVAAVALGAMGLVVTPLAVVVLGSVLFAWHPTIGVAQGLGMRFTIYAILAAPAGAVYWLVAGGWLSGPTAGSRGRRGAVGWAYLGLLLVGIAVIGFSR